MLIWIDDSVVSNIGLSTPIQSIQDSLEMLATASREGSHLILGTKSTLKILSSYEFLSQRAKTAYEHILKNYSTQGAIRCKIIREIKVVWQQSAVNSWEYGRGKRSLVLPLDYFQYSNSIQKIKLIGENELDANFLFKLAQLCTRKFNLGTSKLEASIQGGGGSELGEEIENILDDSRLCLAVGDSDRGWPNCSEKETALNAKAKWNSHRNKHLAELMIFSCRAFENALPYTFYERIADKDSELIKLCTALLYLKSQGHDTKKYLHMKDGIKCRLANPMTPQDCENYWTEVLKLLSTNDLLDISGHKIGFCHNQDCGKIFLSGFGRTFLDRCYNLVADGGIGTISEIFTIEDSELLEFIKITTSWCLAANSNRT